MHIYIRAGDISSTLLSTNNDEHFWGTCKKCFITTIRIKVSWKFKKEPSQPSSLTIISLSLSGEYIRKGICRFMREPILPLRLKFRVA